MNIKKIALGLLTSLLLSSGLDMTSAVRIDTISPTKERIIFLIERRADRATYVYRKIKLFEAVLDYCYYDRTRLERFGEGTISRMPVSEYIRKNRFSDFIELNPVDNYAMCCIQSFDELVYNIAVLYLSYKDLSDPFEFTRHQESVRFYKSMELFHTPEEIEVAKIRDQEEQNKKDEERVKAVLKDRIWDRADVLEPFLSEFKLTDSDRVSSVCEERADRQAVFGAIEPTVSAPCDGDSGVGEHGQFCGIASDKSRLSLNYLDEPFIMPGDFLAELSRRGASRNLFSEPYNPIQREFFSPVVGGKIEQARVEASHHLFSPPHNPIETDRFPSHAEKVAESLRREVSHNPFSAPYRSVKRKFTPSLSEEERERFAREMFLAPSQK